MKGGEEGPEKMRRCERRKRKWRGRGKKRRDRNEGRRVESFHNLRIQRPTWRMVSMHSESADGGV